MKYVLTINQERLLEIAPSATLAEGVMLEFLWHFCSSVSPGIESNRITGKDGRRYTWVSYDHVLQDLPLLGRGSKQKVMRVMRRIEDMGFITSISPDHQHKYIALNPLIERLYRSVDKSTELFQKRNRAVPKMEQLKRQSYSKNGTYPVTTGNPDTSDPVRAGDKFVFSGRKSDPERLGSIIKRKHPSLVGSSPPTEHAH